MEVLKELKKAWVQPESGIYLSKNWRQLKSYCDKNGIEISKEDIHKFIELQNTSDVSYDNRSKRRIAQLGKNFVFRGKLFSQLHGDVMVMKPGRNYGTAYKFLLIVQCQLSRYIFAEPIYSLKFVHLQKAFLTIMDNLKGIFPTFNGGTFFSDGGGEFSSKAFVSLLKQFKLKSNIVGIRPYRGTKGSGVAERAVRRFRICFETAMAEYRGLTFKEKLKKAEAACNNTIVVPLGMSAKAALDMNAMDLVMLSRNYQVKSRKHLRAELLGQKVLAVGTIVRVVRFVDKNFSSTVKESYGRLSPYYIIVDIEKTRSVFSYMLADIFTFFPLSGTFTIAELKQCNISHVSACEKTELMVKKVLKVDIDKVKYITWYPSHVFVAPKTILSIQRQ